MDETAVGDRIRRARLELAARRGREVTQVEIGRALGVTGVTVGRWEAGGAEPSLTQIRRLADFLGVDPRSLAFGAGGGRGEDSAPAGLATEDPFVSAAEAAGEALEKKKSARPGRKSPRPRAVGEE